MLFRSECIEEIDCTREIVKTIRRTCKIGEEIKLKKNSKHLNLSLDVVTRFSSTYKMLNNFFNNFGEIQEFYNENPRMFDVRMPKLSVLSALVTVLKLFDDLTVKISKQKNYTISSFPRRVKKLLQCLEKTSPKNCSLNQDPALQKVEDLKIALKIATESRFEYMWKTDNLALRAALLDPKETRKLDFVSDEVKNEAWNSLVEDKLQFCQRKGQQITPQLKALVEADFAFLKEHLATATENIDDALLFYKKWDQTFRVSQVVRQ